MTDENKKKIYEAARKVCDTAVWGWDAEIDEDNFEEIVDEELIAVIDEMCEPVWKPTDEQIARLENIVVLVEYEWGEYEDNICQELIENVKRLKEL